MFTLKENDKVDVCDTVKEWINSTVLKVEKKIYFV